MGFTEHNLESTLLYLEEEELDVDIYFYIRNFLIEQNEKAVPILINALQVNKNQAGKEFLLARVLSILGEINNKKAIQSIYDLIRGDPERWKRNGGSALAMLGDSRAIFFLIPVLLQIYKSPMYKYEAPSIYSKLEKLGDTRILPAFYWLLYQEGNYPIVEKAQYPELDGSGLRQAIQALEKKEISQPIQVLSSEPFLLSLKDENLTKRREAVLILCCLLKKSELTSLFLQLVNDADEVINSITDFILHKYKE